MNNREKAYKIYAKHNGEITYKEIAKKLDISPGTISTWASRDKWKDRLNGLIDTEIRDRRGNKENKVIYTGTLKEFINKSNDVRSEKEIFDEIVTFMSNLGTYKLEFQNSIKRYASLQYEYEITTYNLSKTDDVAARIELNRLKTSLLKDLLNIENALGLTVKAFDSLTSKKVEKELSVFEKIMLQNKEVE